MLDAALTAIFEEQKIGNSLEELYRGAENLCRGGKAAETYAKLKTRFDGYVGGKLKHFVINRLGRGDEEIVKAIDAAWTKWHLQLVCGLSW